MNKQSTIINKGLANWDSNVSSKALARHSDLLFIAYHLFVGAER